MVKRYKEYFKLSQLEQMAQEVNPRGHDIPTTESSIKRFGYTAWPEICERTYKLSAGHGRVEALREMKDRGEPPPSGIKEQDGEWLVPTLRGWASKNDEELRAYLIASNRIGEQKWQYALLARQLGGIEDLTGVGFSPDEVRDLVLRYGPPPELDDLLDQWGDLSESELWPLVRFRIRPETAKRYLALSEDWPEDDAFRFSRLLDLAER